ncbi:MAG: hypothetical protein ACLR1V_11930 [Coprococcus sp.]
MSWLSRGYEGVGSDIRKSYSGIKDGTPVESMPYVPMDITDQASVEKVTHGSEAGCSRALCSLDSGGSGRG